MLYVVESVVTDVETNSHRLLNGDDHGDGVILGYTFHMYVESAESLAVVKSYICNTLFFFLYGEDEPVGVFVDSNTCGNSSADAVTCDSGFLGYNTVFGIYVSVCAANGDLRVCSICIIIAAEAIHLAVPLSCNEVDVDVTDVKILILVSCLLTDVHSNLECLVAYRGSSRLGTVECLAGGVELTADEIGGTCHYLGESTLMYPVGAGFDVRIACLVGLGVGYVYVDDVCKAFTVLAGDCSAFSNLEIELVLEREATVVYYLECFHSGISGLPSVIVEDFVFGMLLYRDPILLDLM